MKHFQNPLDSSDVPTWVGEAKLWWLGKPSAYYIQGDESDVGIASSKSPRLPIGVRDNIYYTSLPLG